MTPSCRVDKAALRLEMRQRIASVRPLVRAQEEELVNAAIQATQEWATARTVLLYRSKKSEFSVVPLGNAAFREGKRVCFPRVAGAELVLHEVGGWDDLAPGAFGIDEPAAGAPIVVPAVVDLAIVPGVAWTTQGDRLGQGGGFYDRLLAQLGGVSFGVGFDRQVVEALPLEAHDRPVDEVWTARRALQG